MCVREGEEKGLYMHFDMYQNACEGDFRGDGGKGIYLQLPPLLQLFLEPALVLSIFLVHCVRDHTHPTRGHL